ncbi:holin-associated N-acetylmuramidase [Acidimangrovimonas sediminis]|uniref:holin-associated N-acetylmuramidase n=1 Tax=Acidimangrovimonas sediminis TaxID=2056283 RepID=UPI000C802A65|nr:holin-associated N-acetylmuramidase [Acidimangrovimonas sediminis]
MSYSVEEIAMGIVAREGGYVNDPDDLGGATNWGVTLGTMRRLGLDLDHDGDVDTRDVQLLTQRQAVEIFIEHYYRRPQIDRLRDPKLRVQVFDMYVNSGNNAVKILQRLVTSMGFPAADDGAIGPKTLGAVASAEAAAGGSIADAYAVARRSYYFGIADARPANRKYARTRAGGKGGWILRAEEFMSPSLRMTQAQFRARTIAWG